MNRIHTSTISAEMVKLRLRAYRQWLDKPCVHKSVSGELFVFPPQFSVAVLGDTLPIPTRDTLVLNARQDADSTSDVPQVFSVERFYGKILNIHLANYLSSFGRAVWGLNTSAAHLVF